MILVSGASGNIGRELLRRLSDAGIPVRALVRDPLRAVAIRMPRVEIVQGDFEQPQTLEAALDGVEKAFLLSAADERQVELQGNFIQAARRAGVRHVVKLSAMGANLDSPVNFLRWHRQTEMELEASGMAYTHLRPSFFMQNLINFMGPTIRSESKILQPTKEGKLSFIDVRDIAAVALTVLNRDGHEGQAYTLTGGEALSYYEVAEKLSAVLGRRITYVDISPEEYRKAMLNSGIPEWMVEGLSSLYAAIAEAGGSILTATVAEILGRAPIKFEHFAWDYAFEFRWEGKRAA